jgi:hypothetical protein
MKTFTHAPVMPTSRPKTFNDWQKHLQEQLDKIKGTDVAKRLKR